MEQEEKLTAKPVVVPSIWLFVSSTAESMREWMHREVLRHFPEPIFGLARMFHIDASWVESLFVPSSGDPSLDERRMNAGSFFALSDGTVDLAERIKRGKFPWLRFAPLKLMDIGNAKTGARNAPALGRVLFLWNYPELRKFLSEQVQGVLKNREQVRAIEAGFDVERVDIHAYVIWSPGGTGTGLAIGCAELLREISGELNLAMTITGIKLRPGAFKSSSLWRLRANAYANDIELHAVQSSRLVRIAMADGKEDEN